MRLNFLRALLVVALFLLGSTAAQADDAPLPRPTDVEWQPLAAQVKRVAQALELVGAPLEATQKAALDAALANPNASEAVEQVQAVLDPLCLALVTINPESRVKGAPGPAPRKLIQQGWRVFLVKVINEGGVTAELKVSSPNAAPLYKGSTGKAEPERTIKPTDVPDRWLDVQLSNSQPLEKSLSGLKIEYRIIELYSRDVGKREAKSRSTGASGAARSRAPGRPDACTRR